MLIWILSFLVILIVSFILALRSMKDYKESPKELKVEYALYLIQNPASFTNEVVAQLYSLALKDNLIISLERLFKASRSALVIYLPKNMVSSLPPVLNLLELEDYAAQIDLKNISEFKNALAWEVRSRSDNQFTPINDFYAYIPPLDQDDQFWWQVLIQPAKEVKVDLAQKLTSLKDKITQRGESVEFSPTLSHEDIKFNTTIRTVVLSNNTKKAESLKSELVNVGSQEGLVMFPQAATSLDIIKLYQDRSMPIGKFSKLSSKESQLALSSDQILSLLGVR